MVIPVSADEAGRGIKGRTACQAGLIGAICWQGTECFASAAAWSAAVAWNSLGQEGEEGEDRGGLSSQVGAVMLGPRFEWQASAAHQCWNSVDQYDQ